MQYWQKQKIPAKDIPRIAHTLSSSGQFGIDWAKRTDSYAAIRKEMLRQTDISLRRNSLKKNPLSISAVMRRRIIARWTALVDAEVPESKGAGDHDGEAHLDIKIRVPATSYYPYRGAPPCRSYGYGTACSTAKVAVPVGWEIAEEDHVVVVRRFRWKKMSLIEQRERFIVKSHGPYGLTVVRGWCISGFHIESDSHTEALHSAKKMQAERDVAQKLERESFPPWIQQEEMTIADSVAAGNCQAGSMGWASRNFPGRATATIREVLRKAKQSNERRAIWAAQIAARRAERELMELALLSAIA